MQVVIETSGGIRIGNTLYLHDLNKTKRLDGEYTFIKGDLATSKSNEVYPCHMIYHWSQQS